MTIASDLLKNQRYGRSSQINEKDGQPVVHSTQSTPKAPEEPPLRPVRSPRLSGGGSGDLMPPPTSSPQPLPAPISAAVGPTAVQNLPSTPPVAQPGPPSMIDQVVALLRQDVLRSYRVDIETDSTIRGDLTRNQTAMAQFVQGTAQYFQAIAPAVQAGAVGMETAISIYSAFARNFKLGREVDDSLDKLADQAAKQAQNPQPPPPDPKLEMEIQKMQQEMQMNQQAHQQDMQSKQADLAGKQIDLQGKQMQIGLDARAAQTDLAQQHHAAILDLQGKMNDLWANHQKHQQQLAFQADKARQQQQIAAMKARQRPQKQGP